MVENFLCILCSLPIAPAKNHGYKNLEPAHPGQNLGSRSSSAEALKQEVVDTFGQVPYVYGVFDGNGNLQDEPRGDSGSAVPTRAPAANKCATLPPPRRRKGTGLVPRREAPSIPNLATAPSTAQSTTQTVTQATTNDTKVASYRRKTMASAPSWGTHRLIPPRSSFMTTIHPVTAKITTSAVALYVASGCVLTKWCGPNANTMWRKLLYSGFETCFGPSTQGAETKTHLKSRFCAILKKRGVM